MISNDITILSKILDTARRGIPVKGFKQYLKKYPFSISDWAKFMNISERTVARRIDNNNAFDPRESEVILEILDLVTFGISVFGENDNSFFEWLNLELPLFNYQKPISLLHFHTGIQMINDLLGQIEHGVYQ